MFDRCVKVWRSINFQPVYSAIGGKSWLLIAFFAISALVLEWHGKLTPDFAAVITALSTIHVSRAVAQDYHDRHRQSGGE